MISYSLINPVKTSSSSKKYGSLPSVIVFNREVIQQVNGEEGKRTMTYYFSENGDYAAMKPDAKDDSQLSLMVYNIDGSTLMFNDAEKTITIMKMPKIIGEGAEMSKELAEKISHKAIKPTNTKDKISAKPTGKTKTICGYNAVEYEVKTEGGTSFWYYAKVDFNPIKIYTMGAGNSGTHAAIKAKSKQQLEDNPMAIPVFNKNYLLAEVNSGGSKDIETKSITKKIISVSTVGYKIIDMSKMGLGDMIKSQKKHH